MTRETINFTTKEDWLTRRIDDVTSTQIAALFGCSPYMTRFQLWNEKARLVKPEFKENERMKWGNRLEAAIADGVAEELGLTIEPFKSYMRIPECRIGSSFDFRTSCGKILEIKNVDWLIFNKEWLTEGGEMEAPPHIELQIQLQMEVAEMEECILACLVGGNELHYTIRKRDHEIGKMIRAKVAAFWKSIAENNPPEPDYNQDAGTISKLYAKDNGETVDMKDNERLAQLGREYKQAAADESSAKDRKEAARAEILTIIGEASKALADGFTISASAVQGSHGTLVTHDMVGTYINPRKGYRNMRVTEAKKP